MTCPRQRRKHAVRPLQQDLCEATRRCTTSVERDQPRRIRSERRGKLLASPGYEVRCVAGQDDGRVQTDALGRLGTRCAIHHHEPAGRDRARVPGWRRDHRTAGVDRGGSRRALTSPSASRSPPPSGQAQIAAKGDTQGAFQAAATPAAPDGRRLKRWPRRANGTPVSRTFR